MNENTTVSHLLQADGQWKVGMVRRCFLDEEVVILDISLASSHKPDVMVWHCNHSGMYLIKVATD